jgi:hypothetical protein
VQSIQHFVEVPVEGAGKDNKMLLPTKDEKSEQNPTTETKEKPKEPEIPTDVQKIKNYKHSRKKIQLKHGMIMLDPLYQIQTPTRIIKQVKDGITVEPLLVQGNSLVLATPEVIWFKQTEKYSNLTTKTPFKQIDDKDLSIVIQKADLMRFGEWFKTNVLDIVMGILFKFNCMSKGGQPKAQRFATDDVDEWTVQFRTKPIAITPPAVC